MKNKFHTGRKKNRLLLQSELMVVSLNTPTNHKI